MASYRRSGKGRRRNGHAPPQRPPGAVAYGREQFRVTCRRRRGPVTLATVSLDPFVTSLEWGRSGAAMTGTLGLSEAQGHKLLGLVARGDVVRVEVRARSGAAWRPLWEMEARRPTHSVRDGTAVVRLRSSLANAQRSRRSWRFRRDRSHPQGWHAHDVARVAAQRFHVPIGRVAEGRHLITKLIDKTASVVEIVTQAYQEDREHTGRRFDVSIARGVLDVTELRRPRYMLLLGPHLIDAVLEEGIPEGFASAVVVTSTVKATGSTKRRKVRAKVVDRARVRRFGYVVRRVNKDGLDSVADARRYGRRWLARRGKALSTAQLIAPGIPWVSRGDSVKLHLPDAGISAVVFVTDVVHRLGYGSYEMDLTVTVKDPWEADERKARVRRKKEEARRRRGRSRGDEHRTPPRSRKAARRS